MIRITPSKTPTLFASLALLLLLVPSGLACAMEPAGETRSAPAARIVTLTIDYGDGVEKKFKAIPWRKDMTILDAMKYAQKHPRGIKFSVRGRGSTAFLTKIDDLDNKAGRGSNWIYRVNGKLGNRSFAIYKLTTKDAVLWRFGEYQ